MTQTDRTRRYRARQRAGVAILRIPVRNYDLITAMIEAQKITDAGSLDREQVERAVGEMLDEWSYRWLHNL
jgi:hypothetical protein